MAEPELAVDRIRCDGRGLCAELLPELIQLDDWGYPMVAGPVPRHLSPSSPARFPIRNRSHRECVAGVGKPGRTAHFFMSVKLT